MRATSVSPRRPAGSKSGFALLITITLLAFLVLLLVSLASLTRVETQVAGNNQQVAKARQNALMALNIALGEMQKYVGPDQRTTALADMDSTLANTASKNGRWLGAYGGAVAANYADAPTVIADKIAADTGQSNGSQARLLNWLVSGNEGTAFNPATSVGASGEIASAPSVFQFKPDGEVAGLAATSTALSTDITVADKDHHPRAASLLVGANTVGSDAGGVSVSSYVVAPLREIMSEVPGLGAAAVPVGRYAWWVGDEGAKARINLSAATATQARNAFVSAQRAGVEFVDYRNPAGTATLSASDMLDPTGAHARYDPGHASLPSVLASEQLPMLSVAQSADLRQVARYRFHDLTASSSSVLADTYAGGLKKDLSALLASGATSPAETDYLFQPEPGAGYGVPTWGLLRSYATTRTPVSRELTPRVPTTTQVGIAPVLTYGGVGFQYISAGGIGDPIQMALFPIAVLWNPYNATLKGSRYEFGVARRWNAMVQLQAHTPGKTSEWTIKETRDFTRAGGLVTGGAAPNADGSANITSTAAGTADTSGGNYLRFVIDASNVDLLPGESMVFTLAGSGTYSAPMSGPPTNELRKGIRVTAHALMPAASWVAAVHPSTPTEPESTFRVSVYGENAPNRTMYSPATVGYHFSGSEADVYFGEVALSGPDGYGLEPGASGNAKPWIQCFSRITPGMKPGSNVTSVVDGTAVASVLQGPGPLPAVATEPEFLISARSTFSNTTSSSGIRWIAQANPRAPLVTRTRLEGSLPGKSGATDGATWQNFALASSGNASSGSSLDAGTTTINTTLFEYLPEDQPLLSLGQLQHANLSLIGSYPAYPLGNSLADYHFKGTSGDFIGRVHRSDGLAATSSSRPTHLITTFYDVSYLLNRAFWDRYFVSTVPHAGTGISSDADLPIPTDIPPVLPNARHMRQPDASDAALRAADRAASGLMLAGGFNINSTSEQAWRAVLGGINRLPYEPVSGNTGSPLQAALPRFSHPTAAGNADNAPWQGYRQLGEAQIAQLARNIVAEVRNRGPFVSMGDFVNRRLRDNPATTSVSLNADERFKGPIQNAIDASGTLVKAVSSQIYHLSGAAAANPGSLDNYSAASPFTVKNVFYGGSAYTDISLARGGPAYVAPYGARAAFAPQFLTQADVLSAIGSGLVARSDTFVIRTCGEAINPALDPADAGYITGRAWCEAVVQRVVEPLNRKSSVATDAGYNEPAAATPSQPDFGRRFKVVSFRWLTPNDI